MTSISLDGIDEKFRDKVSVQDYSKKPQIDGVKILDINKFVGEDGHFSELIHFNERGECEEFPGFKVAQVNRAKVLPHAIKAWHIHFKQDEIWYVYPEEHLFVGLFDVREGSKTKEVSMKVVLGGKSRLLFIPKGIAHGCANVTDNPANIFYFVSQKFDIKDPDEKRLPWDILGKDFWEAKKE
ncbi:MAG: dTDP-4-dehydrorhamnose 3,5-epimerase family protein [Candidatus Levyibacteriota bacterium]